MPPPQRDLSTRGFFIEARWLLSTYILALMFVPANLTISALGSVGTPAVIIGLLALVLWLGAQMNRTYSTLTPAQPIRSAMLGFFIIVLISYVVATVRPIESLELNGADRGLLLIASWLGLVLLSGDGIRGVDRIESTLRLLVFTGMVVAVVGIVQFVTGAPLVDVIQIPGLSANNDLTSIYTREGFTRAAGTSTHPIEFGVILAMILPLGLHFALSDTHRNRLVRWFPVAVIAFAVPITISRSAILGVVVALVVVLPTWPAGRRRISYVTIAALLGVIYVTIPGMIGTLTKLFTGISEDGSARSRTDSYALAFDFIQRSPLFGRGFSTFLPRYRILDNQYLGLLIEVGAVGTVVLLAVFSVAIVSGFRARRLTSDPKARSLAQALVAMAAAGACSFATFDAFGFPQASGLMFLSVGMIGALSNSLKQQDQPMTPLTATLPR
ncbi:O-antigen ligase domain-containing protein [Cryobacterium algoritolerans]|uniref:O-antigen ligase domain-containing protein n=1 Tax=Cryobacterium algoritolerans TaxID=1259184 RepID=A0A4R8WWS6_9MICO|nr:O-antigen ligase family protein [Cryobacterium algoritolerans]TFC19827.1 O-antigen ligase domain-containing protein [Cryobacterium algoritolerans]